MKILFTGGGTGGHFYPIIAIAQEIRKIVDEEKLVQPKLYYMADSPYNEQILYENGLEYVNVTAGKLRRYFSFKNFSDGLKTAFGIVQATLKMFLIFPDVVVGKGGYSSFPALMAARILGIPVVIHESDSEPGRVNLWAGKFARKIALSYPDAVKFFPQGKTAVTGNPIRSEIVTPISIGAHEFLNLEKNVPVVFIVGGSLGSSRINDAILAILPQLVEKYQIIHQVGKANLEECQTRARVILEKSKYKDRYKLFDYLKNTALRMVAGVSKLIVSRAGSTIFEIANWGIPSIIIPIPESISHDQVKNAFTYARSGGATVIEEENLTPSVLLSEINHFVSDDQLLEKMKEGAKSFANPNAGRTIAQAILQITIQHEQ